MGNGFASMLPTLEKLFQIKRTVLSGAAADAPRELAGIPGGDALRLDGLADGKPFVVSVVTQP
ncbi:MAG: hypothetical protein ACTHJX_07500 [Terriglobales bacterium]